MIERPDCLVVRTPHNPTFWWGNFLLFDHAPRDGDAPRWLARFNAEIGAGQPDSRHVAFGVDAPEPFALPVDLRAAGFELEAATVLTMQRDELRPPPAPLAEGFRIAPLQLPAQAGAAVELQVACDALGSGPADEHRLFRQRQMQRYGAMERAGLGHWFGVFAIGADGERLVADCGLFRDRAGAGALGRFQHVETDPAFRRRGLCRALMHAVCRHGFDAMDLATLVIVADPDDVAIGLYEAVGFRRGVSTWHLQRRPDAVATRAAGAAPAGPHGAP